MKKSKINKVGSKVLQFQSNLDSKTEGGIDKE